MTHEFKKKAFFNKIMKCETITAINMQYIRGKNLGLSFDEMHELSEQRKLQLGTKKLKVYFKLG